MARPVLLPGNPQLYETSQEVTKEALDENHAAAADLHDTLIDFRQTYKAGRAIAAPQTGIGKRLIYMCIQEPVVFLNPVLERTSDKEAVGISCEMPT